MGFPLIKGTFHVIGRSPDGDTLAFRANNKKHWDNLSGRSPRFNMGGNGDITSLRFQAIDTLETHYSAGTGMQIHQPQPAADDATDFTLKAAKIKNVVWGMKDGERTRITSADDGTEGYILAREVERFGRPVAFVFSGKTNHTDGSEPFLTAKWLKQSINFKTLEAGMAYPTYYDAMCHFPDLRDAMTVAAKAAKKAKKGIWKKDKTAGITVNGVKQLIDSDLLMPKLFRRLATYLGENNNKVKGFVKWLEDRDEQIFVVSNGFMGRFEQVISEKGNKISLDKETWDVIFKPE